MLIKENRKNKFSSKIKFYKSIKIFKILGIALSIGFYTYFIAIISSTEKRQLKKMIPPAIRFRLADSIPYQFYISGFRANIPKNIITSIVTPADIIRLDINFLNFEKLKNKRNESLKSLVLNATDEDYVKANISVNNDSYKADIRLKGDWTDHLIGDKWSFRAKLKKGKTIYGMNKFSLQSPRTRRFIWEWVYHEMLRREGLPSLKYKFAPLILNGRNLGVYALEQHFDKILLESNEFKEGPIIKLSEAISWERRAREYKNNSVDIAEKYLYQTQTDLFKKNTTLRNPILKEQYEVAAQLLNGFLEGSLKTSEVFDIKALAKFFAVSDVMNAFHGVAWNNNRFYYDPVQSKLIPIGFDGEAGREFEFASYNHTDLNFFKDPIFIEAYISALERVSSKKYLDKFFLDSEKDLQRNLNILYKSFPALHFDKEILYKNQRSIRDLVYPVEAMNVYLQDETDQFIEVSIGNKQLFPIEVYGIYKKNIEIYKPKKPILIDAKSKGEFPKYVDLKFSKLLKNKNDSKHSESELTMKYKVLGSSRFGQVPLKPYSRINSIEAKNDLARIENNIDEFDFIDINEESKIINLKSGTWTLDKPLILPKNYLVKAFPGMKLILKENGLIYSKSAIDFRGNYENPILIIGDSKKNGISVINSNQTSILEHVIFKNLSSPNHRSWNIPGAVTFYQSPINIDNCIFDNNNSEDGLNIVRSKFKLKNSEFTNTASDAIDIDFSDGFIQNIKIKNAGNDGLDISGSNITLKNINIIKSGDKAISVGEASNLQATDILISDSPIALASKDNSLINANNVEINSADIGFAVFQKKPEYDSAKIEIDDLINKNINKLFLLEKESQLRINDIEYEANAENVRLMLYE